MILRAPAIAAAICIAVLGAGCIERGYPLGTNGNVDIRLDTAGALFAADLLDANGKGQEPRQKPYSTGVTLTLTEGTEAANGGFVDVRVEPAEALALTADPDEDSDDPTCRNKDGKFRCTATPEGIARLILTAEAAWSGEATLIVTWADQRKEITVDVLPAGLPSNATNFELIATGLTDSSRILPTYTALNCSTIDKLPDDLGSKWRPGSVRAREAYVRATPPPNAPGIVENAPVILESLSSEAALSLSPECGAADRHTRLRVLLGKGGESPVFYVCFSDIGGQAEIAVSSGFLAVTPNPTFQVDPEPRVLRVVAFAEKVEAGDVVELFEVSAFNTDLQRIAMPVDLQSSTPSVMKLPQASETLAPEGIEPTRLVVQALIPGKATLNVRPRLFKEPDCPSIGITVILGK